MPSISMKDVIEPLGTPDRDDVVSEVPMDPEQRTLQQIPMQYVRYAVGRAPEHGIEPERILRLAGMNNSLLESQDGTVSPEQFSRLMTVAITIMRDEMIGYGPSRVPPGAWFMMCHSTIHCANLGEALRRLCKFFALFEHGIHPRLTVTEESVKLAFHMPLSKPGYRPEFFVLEMVIFLIHRYINWLISEYIPLNTLSYSLPRPDYHYRLREFFLTTLLQFDAPLTSLTFDRRFLHRSIRQSRQDLDRFLRTGYLKLFTARYAPVSWTSRLKAVIGSNLADVPDFEVVADSFAIHPQTLRRRLAEENTTFRQLKVDVRREAAVLLLQSTKLSIEEISAKVGFSQASAFTRAFKEWAGHPPHIFRARQYR